MLRPHAQEEAVLKRRADLDLTGMANYDPSSRMSQKMLKRSTWLTNL